jgi:hypothetical protein
MYVSLASLYNPEISIYVIRFAWLHYLWGEY